MNTTCANCGSPVTFKNRFSVYGVCPSCGSMLVRVDEYTRNLGSVADMPDDNSPIQLGTHGTWEGKAFEVVGRLKVRYDRGLWNEWYLYFSNDSTGWLAEAQGFWMISFDAPENVAIPRKDLLNLGGSARLGDTEYVVIDLKDVTYAGVEGELPFSVEPDYRSLVVDLGAPKGRFATLDFPKTGIPHAYLGQYVHFDELNLRNLRELEGWKY